MLEFIAGGRTLPQAYHNALRKLDKFGAVRPCPDYNTRQKELSITMVVDAPLTEPMISKLMPSGARELEQYRQEVLDGILDFEVARGNWHYTYHMRMADQFEFIINELRRNPDSRRAVIDIRDKAADMLTDSPACLQHIQYFIRGGCLHCKVLFRSNDAVKATFMNAFALIMLQKRFADELGVGMGSYTHRANSFHAYERDWDLLKTYVKHINDGENLTYKYRGDWDELMLEEQADIAKMVKELEER